MAEIELLDENFRMMERKTFYESVDAMQNDLNVFLKHYNTKRPHQGCRMNCSTLEQAFNNGLKKRLKDENERR